MQEIIQHFQSLDELERAHILKSPVLKEDYVEEVSQIFAEIPFEEVKLILDGLFAKENKDVDLIFEVKEVVDASKVVAWDDGSPYRIKKHRGELMKSFNEILEDRNGLSKTELLVSCKKDNGKWRPIADYVLNYMVGNRFLVKVGCKYYLNDSLMTKESSFHRMVYDFICNGPATMSSILNYIGYRNPKGKRKLLKVLELMESENLVFKEGRHWIILDNN